MAARRVKGEDDISIARDSSAMRCPGEMRIAIRFRCGFGLNDFDGPGDMEGEGKEEGEEREEGEGKEGEGRSVILVVSSRGVTSGMKSNTKRATLRKIEINI